jgi:hypothetical protein
MGKRKSIAHDDSDAEESHSASEPESPKPKIKKPKYSDSKPGGKGKKERETEKGGDTSNVLTSADGERYIDLGKKKRATVREFKGMALLDLREFYSKDGKDMPGKKGISLQVEQWEALKSNMSAIDELISRLKK